MNKVLHLASWYPNKTGVQNGDFIQRHLQAISLFQQVDVIHVVKDKKNIPRGQISEVNQAGGMREKIVYFHPFRSGISFVDKVVSFLTWLSIFKKEIKKYVRENGYPDLIHVHVALWAGLPALWAKRRYGIPYLISEHWTGYQKDDPRNFETINPVLRLYTTTIFAGASAVNTVSENLAMILRSRFRITEPVVIRNVVNTDHFFLEPTNKTPFQFVHVSTLHYQKNVEGILSVLSRLKKIRQDWKCVIIGEYQDKFKKLARELDVDEHLHWKGLIDYRDVAVQMQASSALLMFSRYENLPCVICEALCCGLPVISSDVGGVREIVNIHNGKMVQPGNQDELLVTLTYMLDNIDQYKQRLIAEKAYQQFNYKSIGEKFVAVYNRLMPGDN